jgi:UDP-2,3-diacylglucosamine pyrophosphatase LpxH
MTHMPLARRHRTIWLSDIHLGTRGCKADFLLDFLRHNEAETIYLVGDIVDMWRLRKTWFWAQNHNDVIQKLLRQARKGTRIVFIPGNHDEWLRDYIGLQAGGIVLAEEAVHETADGRRLLVIHGDAYDGVVKYARWLAVLGDSAYTLALWLNHHVNLARRRLGYPYWSLSAYLKGKVKNALEYVGSFREAVADEARRRGLDGVVCGHIHQAEIVPVDGILYCNDGDWVESCTALVEDHEGRLSIMRWAELRRLDPLTSRRRPEKSRIAEEVPAL